MLNIGTSISEEACTSIFMLRMSSPTLQKGTAGSSETLALTQHNYRISLPIRRTFLPEKCDQNSTCVSIISKLINTHENNHEDDFSGSDDDFLGFYDE